MKFKPVYEYIGPAESAPPLTDVLDTMRQMKYTDLHVRLEVFTVCDARVSLKHSCADCRETFPVEKMWDLENGNIVCNQCFERFHINHVPPCTCQATINGFPTPRGYRDTCKSHGTR